MSSLDADIDHQFRIVGVLAPMFPPAFRGGGPIRSIEALVDSIPCGIRPMIVTSDRDLGETEPLAITPNEWCSRNGVEVYYTTMSSPRHLAKAMRSLRRAGTHMLHFNSFMNPGFTITPLLLWRLGVLGDPVLLLTPRGEFSPEALARHGLRKRLYIGMFRLLRIPRRVIWHSTAPHETADIRHLWGEDAVIVERANDTLLTRLALTPEPAHDGPVRAAFLGRIVELKGLHVALRALAQVAAPVRFDVYGAPEAPAYLARCKDLVADLPAHVHVRFHGEVAHEDVVSVLNRYDVLLMPTAGENFGHVIGEALSASCAVVATSRTPWTATLRNGGGVVVPDQSVGSWATTIEELASEGPEQRHRRRLLAGRAYNVWADQQPAPHVWTLAFDAASR